MLSILQNPGMIKPRASIFVVSASAPHVREQHVTNYNGRRMPIDKCRQGLASALGQYPYSRINRRAYSKNRNYGGAKKCFTPQSNYGQFSQSVLLTSDSKGTMLQHSKMEVQD